MFKLKNLANLPYITSNKKKVKKNRHKQVEQVVIETLKYNSNF